MREAVVEYLQGVSVAHFAVGYLVLAALYAFLSFGSEQGRRPRRGQPPQASGCLQHLALGLMAPGILLVAGLVLTVPYSFFKSADQEAIRNVLAAVWLLVSVTIYAAQASTYAAGGGRWGERLTPKYAAAALLYGGFVMLFVYWLFNPVSSPPPECRFAPC